MENWKAILFDFDGVLTDSEPLHQQAWQKALKRYGHDFPEEMRTSSIGVKDEILAEYWVKSLALPVEAVDLLADKKNIFSGFICKELQPFDQLTHWICQLQHVQLGVVTSSEQRLVRPALRSFGIYDILSTVVYAEDVWLHKPAPDPYLLAARRLGLAPQDCLVLEDSLQGIQAAQAAGMHVFGIATSLDKQTLSLADAVFDTTQEALEWLISKRIEKV
jgi:beta-phosphoglucomutase